MMPLPHGTLPLATTPAFTPAGFAPAHAAAAWTQALARAAAHAAHAEGAQAASGSTALPLPIAAPPLASPASGPLPMQHAVVRPAGAGAVPPATTRVPGPLASGGDLPSGKAFVSQPALATQGPAASEPDSEPVRAPRPRTPAQEPSAPRVHVELHDDGLAVWLGLDAGPQPAAACAAAVLDEVRRHAGGTLPRLALFVCNGAPVPIRPQPSKETP